MMKALLTAVLISMALPAFAQTSKPIVIAHRGDELPKFADTMDDALEVIFAEAGVDGLFTDFPDTVVKWRGTHGKR